MNVPSMKKPAPLAVALVLLAQAASAQAPGGTPDMSAPARRPPPQATLKQAGAHFSNKTNVTWSAGHGTQVEYTSADGRAFLWYPGNAVILAGQWSLEEREVRYQFPGEPITAFKQPRVCFRYGANTYNPMTGHRGDGWQCTPYLLHQRSHVETRSGDPLGLARRQGVPFVLPKPDRLTFGQIAARLKSH